MKLLDVWEKVTAKDVHISSYKILILRECTGPKFFLNFDTNLLNNSIILDCTSCSENTSFFVNHIPKEIRIHQPW